MLYEIIVLDRRLVTVRWFRRLRFALDRVTSFGGSRAAVGVEHIRDRVVDSVQVALSNCHVRFTFSFQSAT